MLEKDFWLVSTDHLKDRLWFRDEEDFKKGMNLVAVLAATIPVDICAFILMSNHVHFVTRGNKENARRFIALFKKHYSQLYSYKYAVSKSLLEDNGVDIQDLSLEDESFERAIAYVQMNCVAAKICLHPSGYPWGTGNSFFNSMPIKGTQTGTLSGKALKRLLHSHKPVPPEYIISDYGFIDPCSYVQVKLVESIFRTPRRMNYFLTTSSKARKIKEAPSFSDHMLVSAIKELSISLFRKNDFSEMSEVEKAELLRQLKFRFSCDIGQLARVCGLKYDEVSNLLETFH